jgi:predicted ATPase
LAEERLPAEAGLRDLGDHRLKDLFQPEHIFQLIHPGLSSDFPALATLSFRPNNLPTQTSEFLGREAQLAAIRDLLDAVGVRLLTLTGLGGIGKTRLALQGAADQIDRFEDGVYFVDLSPVRDPDAAFEAMVRAIGLTGTSDEGVLEVLKEQLRPKHMLLVLDNFEQVMDAADGVADLLQQCAELKVLVTSREALRVRGEHLLAVPPLSLPNGSAQTSAEIVAEYEAVRLFVERAREARPSFALTDDNAAAVAEISKRLDGLPLAIELAAARLKLFSPDDLRDRLRSRLELLGRGPRDLPARQQTLRGTIEWSYELLDGEEQAIFQLLSVFSPTRVEAVEEVVARLGLLGEVDVVDRLTSLVDKSLVRSLEGSGPQRLSMLETIREYAAERLEEKPGLSIAARQAHAEYFSDFSQRRRDRLCGPEREATLDDPGIGARQPADGVALLGRRRRCRAAQQATRRPLGPTRRSRLVSRRRRAHERSARCVGSRPFDAGSRTRGDHPAHQPRQRTDGDPRLYAGGGGDLWRGALARGGGGRTTATIPGAAQSRQLPPLPRRVRENSSRRPRAPGSRRAARRRGAPGGGASAGGRERLLRW